MMWFAHVFPSMTEKVGSVAQLLTGGYFEMMMCDILHT